MTLSPVQTARLNSTQLNRMSYSCDPVFIWPHVINTDIDIIYIFIKIHDVLLQRSRSFKVIEVGMTYKKIAIVK